MKSHGRLWARITSEANLREAWIRVRRGHAGSEAIQAFAANLEGNLRALRDELLAGSYRPGAYRQFRVKDPKPRTISCAPVRDRVVHHALCGVITPLLEQSYTEDSYACREGKGTHKACRRARALARRHGWFCKLDVRKFFESIEHDRLLAVLLPRFREAEVRELIEAIVRHPVPDLQAGRGLPIGNLTSQWFANTFLNGLDHYAKETLKAPGYIRYMDDFAVFADSKAECWQAHAAIEHWLAAERGLALKEEATVVAPVSEGVPFLGLRIWPSCWRLKRERFLRTRRKFAQRVRAHRMGLMDEARLQASAMAAEGGVRWFGFKGILRSEEDWAAGEGAASGSNRVKRGGSWNNNARNCRSANRNNNNPNNRNNNNGFRVASAMRQDAQGPIRLGPCPAKAGTNMPGSGRLVAQANAAPGCGRLPATTFDAGRRPSGGRCNGRRLESAGVGESRKGTA
jgi:retron-type reverse transcriptase